MTLFVLGGYLALVLMFALLQRSLIYLPAREKRIEPKDADLPPGRVHTITVRTHDQLELRGWHVLAEGHRAANRQECDRKLAEGRRVALYFSGNAANRKYRIPELSILTRLGVDVFIFDYRGYGDNPGSPTEEKLAADAQTIWNYATQQRNVDPERILLYGESLGGCVAVRLAAEACQAGTPPGGVILRSAFSSLVDAGAYHYPWLPVRLALLDRFPAADRMPQVTCPILQIHGEQDLIIPLELGQRLFEAAPARSSCGVAKQFVELPMAGHNDVIVAAEEELSAAIDDFLHNLDQAQHPAVD